MNQTRKLLDRLIADFPRRKSELEKLLHEMGIDEEQTYMACEPELITEMPTLDGKTSRPLSPMLRERFAHSGAIIQGPETWLAGSELSSVITSEEITMLHQSLRNDWENSLPARYADSELSIFGYTPDVFDEAVYLAWSDPSEEPLVAEYRSSSVKEFACLDDYIAWRIERE